MPPVLDAANATHPWRTNVSVGKQNFIVEMTFLGKFTLKLVSKYSLVNFVEKNWNDNMERRRRTMKDD